MNGDYEYYRDNDDYYDKYVNEQLGDAKKTFSRAGIALSVFLLVANIAVILGQMIMIYIYGRETAAELFGNNIYLTYIFNFASQYLIAFPVFFLIMRGLKPMQAEKSGLSAKDFLVAFLISQAFMEAGSIIGEALNASIGASLGGEITNDVSDMVTRTPIWLVIVAVVIIGPIFEELVFRKILFDRLSKFGAKTAIITTAIAFGLFHGNLYQLFYAAALGLVLGYLYAKTRNIIYPIAMHMLINLFGTVPALLLEDTLNAVYEFLEKMMTEEPFDMSVYFGDLAIFGAYSFFVNALVIAGVILFVIYIKKKLISVPEICDFKIPRGYALTVALANVGAILFLVFTGLTILGNLIPIPQVT